MTKRDQTDHVLVCDVCIAMTTDGIGWKAKLAVGNEDADEVAVYCPECAAAREFGVSTTEQRCIDFVQVSAGEGLVSLPWASRQALLAEMRSVDLLRPVREAFEAAGTSRPVELTLEQKAWLLSLIGCWEWRFPDLYEGLPEGIYELRCAMVDDLGESHSSAG